MARKSAELMHNMTHHSELVRFGRQLAVMSDMYQDEFKDAPLGVWDAQQQAAFPDRWEKLIRVKAVQDRDGSENEANSLGTSNTMEMSCDGNEHCMLRCKAPCDVRL